MSAYLLAATVAAAALFVLLVMVVAVSGPVRRFRVALAAYRARLDADARVLQAGRDELRLQFDHVRHHDRDPAASTIGEQRETEERNG